MHGHRFKRHFVAIFLPLLLTCFPIATTYVYVVLCQGKSGGEKLWIIRIGMLVSTPLEIYEKKHVLKPKLLTMTSARISSPNSVETE
jgi:hypothetical protein